MLVSMIENPRNSSLKIYENIVSVLSTGWQKRDVTCNVGNVACLNQLLKCIQLSSSTALFQLVLKHVDFEFLMDCFTIARRCMSTMKEKPIPT